MRSKPPTTDSAEVEQARAALAALFGDAPPTPAPVAEAKHGQARPAKSKADPTVTGKIDTLRRKREAREALLAAAARHGISLEELQAIVNGEEEV